LKFFCAATLRGELRFKFGGTVAPALRLVAYAPQLLMKLADLIAERRAIKGDCVWLSLAEDEGLELSGIGRNAHGIGVGHLGKGLVRGFGRAVRS